MNFYSFHPGDYTLRTAHLEPLEDLAYRRLLDLYYLNESTLDGSPEELARIIRMRSSAAEVKAILDEFFSPSEAGWQHSHCDEVIAKYHAKAKQAATNGKAGGRPKKPSDNPEETKPVISGLPEKSESKTNQEPETNNHNHNQEDQKPLSPPSADDEEAAKQIKFTTVSEIYNRVCGDVLPRCEALNPKRKTNIRNLCALKIRGGFPFRDSEFWEGYFNDCLTNPHWIGQNDRGWRADLEFLTRTEIALKVLEAA